MGRIIKIIIFYEKNNDRKVIIFGASGAIGKALIDWFISNNFFVYAFSEILRTKNNSIEWLEFKL